MGENAELQAEELEVLNSIYEGDMQYSAPSNTRHTYKFGEDGASRSMILEICWGSEYPAELPDCNLDSFYNKHLLAGVKTAVLAALQEEAEQYLGMGMTYTLFEWMREQLDTLLATQPETLQQISEDLADLKVKESSPEDEGGGKGRGERKEQLTKAQKRAQWKKGGLNESDRERGWNWVDVVK